MFLVWLNDNLYVERRVRRVSITDDGLGSFVEFPSDGEMAGFDVDDRKFVAISRVAGARIVEAADPGWTAFETALVRNGVIVEHLCPGDIARMLRARPRAKGIRSRKGRKA